MKTTLVFVTIALFASSCNRGEMREQPSQPQQSNEADQFIRIGKMDSLHSDVLGEDRPYWVYVPPYDPKSGKKFPVLYLLDGDAHFHSVSGLIQILGTGINGTFVVPEMIVVAIPNTARTRDLTPSHSSKTSNGTESDAMKPSGGGGKFLEFIKTELIPQIESEYPTHPYRVLVGHSFGGIAAINALYTTPETFDAYLVIDPSIWWDDQLLLKKADTIFRTKRFDDKYLFLGQANTLKPDEETNPHFGAIKEYVKLLESPVNKSGIKWSYKYYPDDSHGSVPMITEYDGLRFIFKQFSVKAGMDPELLKKSFANYKMPPPEDIVNRLGYTALGQKNIELAEKYFQMNLEAYPQSSNVYDSMGELMLTKGDTAQALQLYKKSLEIDPSNENASKVVGEILARKK